jgi:hypothetical protein
VIPKAAIRGIIRSRAACDIATVLAANTERWLEERIGTDWSPADEIPPGGMAVGLQGPLARFVRRDVLDTIRGLNEDDWRWILDEIYEIAPEVAAGCAPPHLAPQVAERLRREVVRLGDIRAFPWYCRCMNRLRDRLLEESA